MHHSTHSHRLIAAGRQKELLAILRERFEANPARHPGLEWAHVVAKLEANPEKLRSLGEMERTGGEPDVVGRDEDTGAFLFFDCAPESPVDRRSLCYDQDALDSRKAHKPATSAMHMAGEMGVDLLSESDYQRLQAFGAVDTKTSSWLETPPGIRSLGGAIFGDHRFGRVFIYHNGAQSYYAARGFRAKLAV